MSILIKGMEMPKTPFLVCIYPNGICSDEEGKTYRAVPVPPHGDLIDRDVLGKFREIVTTDVPGGKLTREYVPMAAVRNVKTIIPASGGNEDE